MNPNFSHCFPCKTQQRLMGTMFNSHEARACVSLPSLRESLRTCSYTEERATRDTPHRRVEWFVSGTIEREFFEGRVRQKGQKIVVFAL